MKRALITGITGQDGSYLTELLLKKGYEVHGLVRRHQFENPYISCPNIRGTLNRVQLYAGSLDDYQGIEKLIDVARPDECYHLAAQSFVHNPSGGTSETIRVNIEGTNILINALKSRAPQCKFYFAGSSEMFGNAPESPQNENTPFRPRNPYAISKLAGYHSMRAAREEHGFFGCAGFCFNHESPRRGSSFVTRKITSSVARIAQGSPEKLRLGSLDGQRDWGYAPDYVEAMWRMLQQPTPDDYVLATGKTHTVRDFVERAFGAAGLNWKDHVVIDEQLVRPQEKVILCGDATKARRVLTWAPTVSFEELVPLMVEADRESLSREHGLLA